MKKCKNCSKEFVPKTIRAQFCSDNCRVNFGRIKKRLDKIHPNLIDSVLPETAFVGALPPTESFENPIQRMKSGSMLPDNFFPKPTKEELINSIPGVKTAAEIGGVYCQKPENQIEQTGFNQEVKPLVVEFDDSLLPKWAIEVLDYCEKQSITPKDLIGFHRTKGNKPEKKKMDVTLSKEGEARQAAEKGHYDRRKNKLGF